MFYRSFRTCFSAVNISVLRAVNACLLLMVNSKSIKFQFRFVFTPTICLTKCKIYCDVDSLPSIKVSENDCFFLPQNTVANRKNEKIVSYTVHENTQICKMTEDFMAFVFTIRRRRLKNAFTGRKTKILVRKRGVRKGLNLV